MKDRENQDALNHLFWKDEILQVMYWVDGEGLGTDVTIDRLASLLGASDATLSPHVDILVVDGYLKRTDDGCVLTDFGKKEAGQRFASAFQGLQKAGHGECGPDCDCQWEGHESCQHHHHVH